MGMHPAIMKQRRKEALAGMGEALLLGVTATPRERELECQDGQLTSVLKDIAVAAPIACPRRRLVLRSGPRGLADVQAGGIRSSKDILAVSDADFGRHKYRDWRGAVQAARTAQGENRLRNPVRRRVTTGQTRLQVHEPDRIAAAQVPRPQPRHHSRPDKGRRC
jgi:hypothetical protein